MASLEGMAGLLQQIDNYFWGQEGLPVGVNDRTKGQVGALSDTLLQFLDTVETHRLFCYLILTCPDLKTAKLKSHLPVPIERFW